MNGLLSTSGGLGSVASGRLSRRAVMRFGILGFGALGGGLLLAACGADTGAGPETAPTPTTAAPAPETPAAGVSPTPQPSPVAAGPVRGGELIFALSSDPPNLDPHISTGTAARTVKLQLYNGLLRYVEDGTFVPDLAEAWQITEDGLEYTFPLKQNVQFHDGSPLTARDVEATVRRIRDESVGATRRVELANISEVTIVDDHTVRFTLQNPHAALLAYLALPECAILSSDFLARGGDPNTEVIGTGPFTFVSREPGVRIEVARNENYHHEGLPYLDRIIFIPYPDENTRMSAVRGGDAQMADYVPWKDMSSVEQDPDLKLETAQNSAFMCVIYNVRQRPFDDPRVRVALSYAYDRKAIIDAAFFGRAIPMTGGVIPPQSWAYNQDLEGTYTYDPDRAKRLLAEAGYPNGFSVTLLATSQYGMHQSTAEVVQNNLQAIGIDCKLELYDWQTVVQKHSKGEYQFRVHGLALEILDPDALTNFFQTGSPFHKSTGFSDEEIDRLLKEGRTIQDEAERRKIYNQLERRLLELAPWSFLVYRQDGDALRRNVHGYKRLPGGLGFIAGVMLQHVWIER